jgi:hypothetical protein
MHREKASATEHRVIEMGRHDDDPVELTGRRQSPLAHRLASDFEGGHVN